MVSVTPPVTPKPLPYVRCRDLEGELWTVPAGSTLHLQLLGAQLQGSGELFVPVELLRAPWRGLVDLHGRLVQSLARWQEAPQEQSVRDIWRLGQYQRMLKVVKEDRNEN